MGSWVGPPQARRLMFMTIPEKYKLWSLGLCSKNFEKLVRKKIETFFLRKFFIEFPNKNIFQPTFSREKKSRNVDIFAIFSLENVGRKNIFVRKSNEKFSKTIFFRKKNRTNFSKFLDHRTTLQSLYFSGMVMNIDLRACGDQTQLPMLCVEFY